MKKEKAFIVLSHMHKLDKSGQWKVHENVEIVDNLRNRHYSYASAIGDYINRKIIVGEKVGMGNYENFENYIRRRYEQQMSELDNMYNMHRTPITEIVDNKITDEHGNVREKTIFDV